MSHMINRAQMGKIRTALLNNIRMFRHGVCEEHVACDLEKCLALLPEQGATILPASLGTSGGASSDETSTLKSGQGITPNSPSQCSSSKIKKHIKAFCDGPAKMRWGQHLFLAEEERLRRIEQIKAGE